MAPLVLLSGTPEGRRGGRGALSTCRHGYGVPAGGPSMSGPIGPPGWVPPSWVPPSHRDRSHQSYGAGSHHAGSHQAGYDQIGSHQAITRTPWACSSRSERGLSPPSTSSPPRPPVPPMCCTRCGAPKTHGEHGAGTARVWPWGRGAEVVLVGGQGEETCWDLAARPQFGHPKIRGGVSRSGHPRPHCGPPHEPRPPFINSTVGAGRGRGAPGGGSLGAPTPKNTLWGGA